MLIERIDAARQQLMKSNATAQAVAADSIRRIVQLGEQNFVTMTGCDEWDEALFDHVTGRV